MNRIFHNRFEHISKYRYGILQNLNIEISGFRYQIQYHFKMVQLGCSLYYSDNILMIDIQTDSI